MKRISLVLLVVFFIETTVNSQDYKFGKVSKAEYEVVKKPSSKGIKLPNNGGTFLLNVGDVRDGKITLSYRYQLKKHLFSAEEYHYLKEFFNEIIKIHTTYIELKKI